MPVDRRAGALHALQRGTGNAALSRVLARSEKGTAKGADPAAKGWEALPGGKLLYEELIKAYPPEKLLGLALPQLSEQSKQLSAVAAPGVGLTGDETAGLAGGVASFADRAAKEWMKTPEGKAWLAKAATWVKENPKTVYGVLVGAMAAAIAGAAIAYFTGTVDPPALEKKFKALGLDVTAGVDVGRFRERILDSARLSASKELTKGVTVTVEGHAGQAGKEAEWAGGGSVDLGVYDFKAGYGFQSGDKGFHQGTFSYKPKTFELETTLMVKLLPDGSALLDTSAIFDLAGMDYKLGLKGPLGGSGDGPLMFSFGRSATGKGGAFASESFTFDPSSGEQKGTYGFGFDIIPGLKISQQLMVGAGGVEKTTTKLTGKALRDTLAAELAHSHDVAKGTDEVSGSLTIKREDVEWAVRAALTDGELASVGMSMGVTEKDAFKFLVDAALSRKDGVDKATLKTIIQAKVRKWAFGIEASGSITEGGKSPGVTFSGSASAVYLLPKDWWVGASADVFHGARPDAWGKGPAATQAGGGVLFGHAWSPVGVKAMIMADPSGTLPPIFSINLAASPFASAPAK